MPQVQGDLRQQLFHRLPVGGDCPRPQGIEPDRALEGAGVDVEVAEVFGDRFGDGAFAGAGRAVNGD